MRLGNPKAAAAGALLVLTAFGFGACGSSGGETTTQPPAIAAATARHLAELSDRVATDLDAGDTCGAAVAADDLQSAVADAHISASLRPGIEAVTTRLVNDVNCPPPPPPPAPEHKPKKHENQQGNEHHGGDEKKPKPPSHGGKLPPGKAKLEGEG
jgi:hypothetical protein